VQSGKCLQAFRRNVQPPFSGWKSKPNMEKSDTNIGRGRLVQETSANQSEQEEGTECEALYRACLPEYRDGRNNGSVVGGGIESSG
jgi:hypothetical protein